MPKKSNRVTGSSGGRMRSLRRQVSQVGQWLRDDWHGARYGILGLVLLFISSMIVSAYYINHPTPETYPDSLQYIAVSHKILTTGNLVDPMRLPGYPLLIMVVFLLAGQGNLLAVSIVQGVLFVIAVLEIYVITCLLTHRAWHGLIVGLIVTSNIYLLTFIKPILSEGFSLWIVTSLALAILLFIRAPRAKRFWLIVLFLFVAFMVRPEWIYAPVLIFAFLLLVAARHGQFRRLVPHALAAVLVLYGMLGLYIYENVTLNGYAGVSVVERINLLGKVMQYNMQDEASPQYAALTREIDAFRAAYHQSHNPYLFSDLYPYITTNYWVLPDGYTLSIVEHHPFQFVADTVPIFFNSLSDHYYESRINTNGHFGSELLMLNSLSQQTIQLYQLFPFLALFWLVLLFWRRTARSSLVEMMAALSFLGFYELVLIASGGYEAYARLHSAFNPLLMVVVCGSLLLALSYSARLVQKSEALMAILARLWPVCRVGGVLVVVCIVASAVLTVITRGFSALRQLNTWRGLSFVYSHPNPFGMLFGAALCLLIVIGYDSYHAYHFAPAQPASKPSEQEMLKLHMRPIQGTTYQTLQDSQQSFLYGGGPETQADAPMQGDIFYQEE